MRIWNDWTDADGNRVHLGDDGHQHTIGSNGIASTPDPYFSQADMDAYQSGEIDVIEYRHRYAVRYHLACDQT
jgi:hypothetical protein